MTRSKVKLTLIADEATRRTTFRKRKKGLLKKVSELSTLCGVNACAIVFGPNGSQSEVWPSPIEANQVLNKFRELPEMEQTRKMLNQEEFMRQRTRRVKEQLDKIKTDNRVKEMKQMMMKCLEGKANILDLNLRELGDVAWLLDSNVKDINEKIEKLKNNNITVGQSSHALTTNNSGGYGHMNIERMQGESAEAYRRPAPLLNMNLPPPPSPPPPFFHPHRFRQMSNGEGSSSYAAPRVWDNHANVAWEPFPSTPNFFP